MLKCLFSCYVLISGINISLVYANEERLDHFIMEEIIIKLQNFFYEHTQFLWFWVDFYIIDGNYANKERLYDFTMIKTGFLVIKNIFLDY